MDYLIKTNEFEGPLDLLLHLVKQTDINIYDLNIDIITKQYLACIRQMEDINLTVASEYLVMAAELIEIKSKSLIPNVKEEETDDYVEDPKETLIKKLIEYEKYKNVSNQFKDLEEERGQIYTKAPASLKEYQLEEVIKDNEATVDDLLNAFSLFLERQKFVNPLPTKITSKELSIKERTSHIRQLLKNKKAVKFSDLFDIIKKDYIIITFLAILEMAKKQEIVIDQKENFKEIFISLRGKENES